MTRDAPRRFSRPLVAALAAAKIIGIRAGSRSAHRIIGVWVVVVDDRAFVRSWTLTKNGWHRTLLEDPVGIIQVGEREVRIRAVPARSEPIRDAVDRAYAEKYPTPGSVLYVRGFRSQRRRETTMELVPR